MKTSPTVSKNNISIDISREHSRFLPEVEDCFKKERKAFGNRLKDTKDPLKLVIVRDMWLTGFDAPCLKTMYVDKPMRGTT